MDFGVSNQGLALISGGLDSLLAARWLGARGWRLHPVHFESGFVAPEVAARIDLAGPAERVPLAAEHLGCAVDAEDRMRGRACRTLFLERARALADRASIRWIVTGDVIGQDRCGQSREAFAACDRDAGVEGRVLRPLSAAQLGWSAEAPPLVELLALHGTSRRGQLALAAQLGLADVPPTRGGCCRFAAPAIRRRAEDLLAHLERPVRAADLELLALGRRHRLDGGSVLLIARDAGEAERINRLAAGAPRVVPIDGGAPGWLLGEIDDRAEVLAARLVAASGKHSDGIVALELVVDGVVRRVDCASAAAEELVQTRI